MSGARTGGTRRQGAPEAGEQAALSWRVHGIPNGVPSRLGFPASSAPLPAARRPASQCSTHRPASERPHPTPSATRLEPGQPPAHLLGAWPPAKALLHWRGGDKGA